jgi:lysophospholipase L1-like esterase
MNLRLLAVFLALSSAVSLCAQTTDAPAAPSQPATFEFKDGDRLVLIGNTVFEREQRYGAFEPRLALALGDTKVSVRNLAWSGDTVFGHARSYFGPPEEGLQRLSAHLELLKPTVVMLCYGSELAFERLGGLPDFLSAYRNLIEIIRSKSPGARIIVVSPPPLETLAPPLPDLSTENGNLSSLRDALRKFSSMQNAYYIDWFELMGGLPKPGRTTKPLTENGVHYTQEGYEKLCAKLVEGLGLKMPVAPSTSLENLRRAVIAKDTLFFNRWRPQNETYLFGFRKHEQGQNAKEIPMFDPLITQGDEAIQKLKTEALAQTRRP